MAGAHTSGDGGATAASSSRIGHRCTRCLRLRRSSAEGFVTFVRARSACEGAPEVLRRAARFELGHNLIVASMPDGGVLVYCLRCGGMGVELIRTLAHVCMPRPAALQPFRRAILAGRHPKNRAELGPLQRVASIAEAETLDGG